jgi:hypothetical protein
MAAEGDPSAADFFAPIDAVSQCKRLWIAAEARLETAPAASNRDEELPRNGAASGADQDSG